MFHIKKILKQFEFFLDSCKNQKSYFLWSDIFEKNKKYFAWFLWNSKANNVLLGTITRWLNLTKEPTTTNRTYRSRIFWKLISGYWKRENAAFTFLKLMWILLVYTVYHRWEIILFLWLHFWSAFQIWNVFLRRLFYSPRNVLFSFHYCTSFVVERLRWE